MKKDKQIIISNYSKKHYIECLNLRVNYNQQYRKKELNLEKHKEYIDSCDIKKVAMGNQQMMGFVRAKTQEETIHIISIHTATDFQNQGIGSLLLSHIEDIAHREHKKQVTLSCRKDNLSALERYEKKWYKKASNTTQNQYTLHKKLSYGFIL